MEPRTEGQANYRGIDSNSLGQGKQHKNLGRGWDRDGCLEVSSESAIPETGKETDDRPEVGECNTSNQYLNTVIEKGGLDSSMDEEGQHENGSPRLADVMMGIDSNYEQLPSSDMNLITIPLQFAATRIRQVGRPRGRGRRARGLLPNTSRKRVSGTRIIDVDELAIQGLGSPWTVRSLGELVKKLNPGLVFISETKRSARRCEFLRDKWNYFGVGVDAIGSSGGLYLLWRKDLNITLQSFSFHHIDITVTENGKNSWRFTGFYGHPDAGQRKESWDLLRKLSKKSIRPWLCAGDFNEILSQNEKFGQLARPQWQIDAFRRCLEDCQLTDMGAEGEMFTWSNRRELPQTVRARLDRACCTTAWMAAFPRARATNLMIGGSDHCIVQISLDQMGIQGSHRRPKRFRFEAAWLREPSCEEVIQAGWKSVAGSEDVGGVSARIRSVRVHLLQWGEKGVWQCP
ncbi:UNVERIFIED_CONTAM: hypothetical protein Sradi_6170800 [Sesamum radiatum]|uniref:Endonuclease/exonuclease/phosphatase domain-containing protein n=1 Tax=Sesamum radiatum TaxID=300843 RepID=A0AAW2K8V4_SESRA